MLRLRVRAREEKEEEEKEGLLKKLVSILNYSDPPPACRVGPGITALRISRTSLPNFLLRARKFTFYGMPKLKFSFVAIPYPEA